MPQSCPVALNASGGAPTETSSRNWCCRAHTSALSPSTMNGRSPNSCTPLACARASVHPLRARGPLEVLVEQHFVGELATCAIDGGRLAPLQLDRPFGPQPLLLARVQRAEQAVVLDPPRLLARIGAKRPASIGVAPPLLVEEPAEGRPQVRQLQPADLRIRDARRRAHLGEGRTIGRRQAALAAERLEFGDPWQVDEDRIDRHRADGRVRRLLPGRHLVQRQELQHTHPGGGEPRGCGFDVGDVADPPARTGGAREKRNQQARPSAAEGGAHGCLTVQSKCRRTRSTPSANAATGGSRLTTRNDSRGKSKKYPGCASTPSSVSNCTTRSSSGSSDGTCSTAYHPPSLRKTRHDGTRVSSARSAR